VDETIGYDLLKHLEQTPAKITVAELIRKSKSHQDVLLKFLQRIRVSEDISPERIVGSLFTFTNGPPIMFPDEELESYEYRILPLCIAFS